MSSTTTGDSLTAPFCGKIHSLLRGNHSDFSCKTVSLNLMFGGLHGMTPRTTLRCYGETSWEQILGHDVKLAPLELFIKDG